MCTTRQWRIRGRENSNRRDYENDRCGGNFRPHLRSPREGARSGGEGGSSIILERSDGSCIEETRLLLPFTRFSIPIAISIEFSSFLYKRWGLSGGGETPFPPRSAQVTKRRRRRIRPRYFFLLTTNSICSYVPVAPLTGKGECGRAAPPLCVLCVYITVSTTGDVEECTRTHNRRGVWHQIVVYS